MLVERERGGGEERVYAGVSVPVDCVCVWCVGKRVRVRDGRIPMERGGDAARIYIAYNIIYTYSINI